MTTSLPTNAPAAAACQHQVASSLCGLRQLCLPDGFSGEERHDERILEMRQRDVRILDTQALQGLVGGTPA